MRKGSVWYIVQSQVCTVKNQGGGFIFNLVGIGMALQSWKLHLNQFLISFQNLIKCEENQNFEISKCLFWWFSFKFSFYKMDCVPKTPSSTYQRCSFEEGGWKFLWHHHSITQKAVKLIVPPPVIIKTLLWVNRLGW